VPLLGSYQIDVESRAGVSHCDPQPFSPAGQVHEGEREPHGWRAVADGVTQQFTDDESCIVG
jgi:hypothetical protein